MQSRAPHLLPQVVGGRAEVRRKSAPPRFSSKFHAALCFLSSFLLRVWLWLAFCGDPLWTSELSQGERPCRVAVCCSVCSLLSRLRLSTFIYTAVTQCAIRYCQMPGTTRFNSPVPIAREMPGTPAMVVFLLGFWSRLFSPTFNAVFNFWVRDLLVKNTTPSPGKGTKKLS